MVGVFPTARHSSPLRQEALSADAIDDCKIVKQVHFGNPHPTEIFRSDCQSSGQPASPMSFTKRQPPNDSLQGPSASLMMSRKTCVN